MLKFTPTHPHSEYFYKKSLWKPKCRPDMILLASNSPKNVLCTDLSSGRGLLPLSLQRSRPPVPAFAALLPAHCHPAACQAVPGVHNQPAQPANTINTTNKYQYIKRKYVIPFTSTLQYTKIMTNNHHNIWNGWLIFGNAVLVVSWKVGWKCIKPTNTQMGFGW